MASLSYGINISVFHSYKLLFPKINRAVLSKELINSNFSIQNYLFLMMLELLLQGEHLLRAHARLLSLLP